MAHGAASAASSRHDSLGGWEMSRAQPAGSPARAFHWCHIPSWTPGRCSVPNPQQGHLGSLICSRGALFTQDINRLPVPAGSGAHCGWYRQQAALRGSDFGGEIAVSRGGKAGRGPRGMQRRRGNTSRQRAEPTRVADGPRPPPARLGRHKCVSLRVPDCRGVTGREITPGYHGNITSRDMPCCHPATRKGSPGTEGCSAAPEEDEGPTQPLGRHPFAQQQRLV